MSMVDLLFNFAVWFVATIPVWIGSSLLHAYIKTDQKFRFWWVLYAAILFLITGFYTVGGVV